MSLEAQEAKIRAWAKLHDRELIAVKCDAGISGKRADTRPALQEAIRLACLHRVPLVVYSLSRLARSTLDAITISEKLRKAKADLVSLTEQIDTTTASGRLFFRLMSSMAEFERDLTAERTKAALQHLWSQRRRVSRYSPFGYDLGEDGSTMIPNMIELEWISKMRSLREEGASFREIVKSLEVANVSTKRGGQWSAKTVRAVLLRDCDAA